MFQSGEGGGRGGALPFARHDSASIFSDPFTELYNAIDEDTRQYKNFTNHK